MSNFSDLAEETKTNSAGGSFIDGKWVPSKSWELPSFLTDFKLPSLTDKGAYGSNYLMDNGNIGTYQFGSDTSMTPGAFKGAGNTLAQYNDLNPKNKMDMTTWDGITSSDKGATGGTDWSGLAGIGLAGGQIGLGVMSYLDQKKTNNLNRKLLDQQYANNATTIANKAADRTYAQNLFGTNASYTPTADIAVSSVPSTQQPTGLAGSMVNTAGVPSVSNVNQLKNDSTSDYLTRI